MMNFEHTLGIMDQLTLDTLSKDSKYYDIDQSGLGLTQIKYAHKKDKLLRGLNLSRNKLSSILPIKESSLLILNVSRNNLSTLKGIESSSKLRFINASFNKLTAIDTNILQLKQVEEIYLSDNHISKLSKCEDQIWAKLKVLDLTNNRLSEPEDLIHLVS